MICGTTYRRMRHVDYHQASGWWLNQTLFGADVLDRP